MERKNIWIIVALIIVSLNLMTLVIATLSFDICNEIDKLDGNFTTSRNVHINKLLIALVLIVTAAQIGTVVYIAIKKDIGSFRQQG